MGGPGRPNGRERGFTAGGAVFGVVRRSFPGPASDAPRAERLRSPPERLMFFTQRYPPEETSIGPGKRSLDLLTVH
jgi:hypothetical protein